MENKTIGARHAMEKQLLSQPQEVGYCTRCVVSNQRPRIRFNEEGICGACQFSNEKYHVVDWADREIQLKNLLDRHRSRDGRWDVLVPCSGGKDASYVAHQLKHRYGMHPLTVTFSPFIYTDIGMRNMQNFIKSGFENWFFSPNGRLHRKLARLCFEEVGDAWQPFTFGQMAYAFHVALKTGIPLVFYGENGEAEYGGNTKSNHCPYIPVEEWADFYFKGVTVDDLLAYGTKHKDYLAGEKINESDLEFYRPPKAEELKRAGIQMHWYSYYHKWVPQENYYYATEHTGFKANPERSEGTYSKYASLDDQTDGFHFFMAFIKFGIGRATSDAAHEIRDGHLTREEGVALVRRYDGEFPAKYFKAFLEYLDISEERFWEVADSFRPAHLWEKKDSRWRLKHQVS